MPSHLPTAAFFAALPEPTAGKPLRVLFSACLAGKLCGYDGSSYGEYPQMKLLMNLENVKPVYFCPEETEFCTPRELCNIHGGNGFDVLAGRARVLTETGVDWTAGMVAGAGKMLAFALKHQADLAILMDTSAACGSQVIYDGNRTGSEVKYQQGHGVCAALLMQNNIPVMSQRDLKTLDLLFQKLDPAYVPDPEAKDHHETDWYRGYFST